MRTRIKGTMYYLSDAERRRFGGRDYLLVREPSNSADRQAVAVYGKGRQVGHLSASRAAMMAPLLDKLDADASLVSGAGCSDNSSQLWVDIPKIDELRKFLKR